MLIQPDLGLRLPVLDPVDVVQEPGRIEVPEVRRPAEGAEVVGMSFPAPTVEEAAGGGVIFFERPDPLLDRPPPDVDDGQGGVPLHAVADPTQFQAVRARRRRPGRIPEQVDRGRERGDVDLGPFGHDRLHPPRARSGAEAEGGERKDPLRGGGPGERDAEAEGAVRIGGGEFHCIDPRLDGGGGEDRRREKPLPGRLRIRRGSRPLRPLGEDPQKARQDEQDPADGAACQGGAEHESGNEGGPPEPYGNVVRLSDNLHADCIRPHPDLEWGLCRRIRPEGQESLCRRTRWRRAGRSA